MVVHMSLFKPDNPRRQEHPWENSMVVLDYMELGNPSDRHFEHRNQPLVQGVGTKYFTLLEANPLPAVRIDILEKVELGYPSKVKRVMQIYYDDLTSMAKANLPEALKMILNENEKVFVEFFNIADPVNIRLHALELLPGIGKKTMRLILDERATRRFESFEDIRQRIKVEPVKILIERLLKEFVGGEKYYLFLKPKEKDAIYLRYLERLYGEIL
jgi:putative nucleotide binding protein